MLPGQARRVVHGVEREEHEDLNDAAGDVAVPVELPTFSRDPGRVSLTFLGEEKYSPLGFSTPPSSVMRGTRHRRIRTSMLLPFFGETQSKLYLGRAFSKPSLAYFTEK